MLTDPEQALLVETLHRRLHRLNSRFVLFVPGLATGKYPDQICGSYEFCASGIATGSPAGLAAFVEP